MTDKRRGLESLLEESRIVDESSRALMATYPKESRSSYDARHMAQSLAREQAMRDAELRKELYFKEIDEKDCLFCHQGNQTGFKPWDYKEKREKIRHW